MLIRNRKPMVTKYTEFGSRYALRNGETTHDANATKKQPFEPNPH